MLGRRGARSAKQSSSSGMKSVVPNKGRSSQESGTQSPWGTKPKYPVQAATNIENKLRYALLRKGINFIEQASIGPWSIDFLLPDYMACVEADGEFWHSSTSAKMKDRRKDAWLRNNGYIVFHFDGEEIHKDADFCVEKMMKSIDKNVANISEEINERITELPEQSEPESIERVDQETTRITQEPDEYEQWIARKT